MTRSNFGMLDVCQQEELIHQYGNFVFTEVIGNYLCDVYRYDSFFVLFYYLCDEAGVIKSHCFDTLASIEYFMNSLEKPK